MNSRKNKVIFTFAALALTMLAAAIAAFQFMQSSASSGKWVRHTYEVRDALDRSLSTMADAETGVRGYILTDNETFLEPYNRALKNIKSEEQEIRGLTKDNPVQQRNLDILTPLITQKLSQEKNAVGLRKSGGYEATASYVKGKAIMDEIRRVESEMDNEERVLLARRLSIDKANADKTFDAIVGGFSLAFIFLSIIVYVLIKEVKSRITAEEAKERLQALVDAKEALRESEAQFRTFADSIPTLCWMANGDGWIYWYNSRWYEYTGTTPEQMEGWGWKSVHDPEALPEVMEQWKASIATGNPFDMTFPLKGADGVFRPFLTRIIPVRDQYGKVVRWFGTNTDITEQKRAENELRKSQNLLSEMGKIAKVGGWEFDMETQALKWTEEVYRIHEVELSYNPTVREAIDFYAPDSRPVIAQAVQRGIEFGEPWDLNLELITAKGNHRWVQAVGKADRELKIISGTFQDITDRKLAEDELRKYRDSLEEQVKERTAELDVTNAQLMQQREWLNVTLHSIGDSVISTDREGRVTFINPVAEQATGWKADEAIGQPLVNVFNIINELTRQPAENPVARVLREGYVIGLANHTALISKNGNEIPIEDSAAPIRDADDNIIGVILVFHDASEKRRTEDEALRMQKLESLRVLAGGIAHDLNNMMVAVEGNAGMALSVLGNDSPASEYLIGIETASEKVAAFSKQILSFTGRSEAAKEPVRLNDVIHETARFLLASISKKAVIEYSLSEYLPSIEANQQNIQQIVMNLIINASEALGDEKGTIMVSTGKLYAGRSYLDSLHPTKLPEGEYVYIEVSDTGCGMSPETRKRVYDPFYTTKFTGRGLGLSAVSGIVIAHGGAIGIESPEGCGATFRVLLPIPAEPVEVAEAKPVSEGVWSGKGTILVVDDEKDSLLMAKKVLEGTGYIVLTAEDGSEAIKKFKENANSITAVIMDLIMPHGRGDEAAKEIRKMRNDISILLLSGYHEVDLTEISGGPGKTAILEKPYKITKLLGAVQNILKA